jgi:HD-GYP domain-containing protein (c-di-GMP phosphodiesterase class II)
VPWFLTQVTADISVPRRLVRLARLVAEGGQEMAREATAAHCEVAEMVARRLELPDGAAVAVRYAEERWDGKGLYGLKGADTPLLGRILHLAQTIDAVRAVGGPEAALAAARQRRRTDFDPDLVDLLVEVAAAPDFWRSLEQGSLYDSLLAGTAASPPAPVSSERQDAVCVMIADVTDVISERTWGHSFRVAEVAVGMAGALGLPEAEVALVQRSALAHDLGKVTVPAVAVDRAARGEPLSPHYWERYRLHPYYTERILGRVPAFRPLAAIAAAHHEHLDGSGFAKGLTGEQLAPAARILAVADAYALIAAFEAEPEAALRAVRRRVGSELDPECFDALRQALGSTLAGPKRRVVGPAKMLSEREVEVLRLVAGGQTNREMARALGISEKTVEHHVSHIFDKLGVTSRTSAAVFALQNGLIA